VQCESRLPGWDAAHELLTLDFPPHRALLASVQNFQLVHATTTEGGHAVGRAGAGTGETARERVVLVHGLLREAEGGVDTSNPNPIPNPIPNPYPNPNPNLNPNQAASTPTRSTSPTRSRLSSPLAPCSPRRRGSERERSDERAIADRSGLN